MPPTSTPRYIGITSGELAGDTARMVADLRERAPRGRRPQQGQAEQLVATLVAVEDPAPESERPCVLLPRSRYGDPPSLADNERSNEPCAIEHAVAVKPT
jgi:hypothetical protein